ncbi:MAG: sarcosine oxidase subunit gamma [Maricaulaceae bacterium]
MSKLYVSSPLDGFSQEWQGISLAENTGYELVSLAVSQGHEDAFAKTFKKTFKAETPKPNHITHAKDASVMWLEADKYLVMLGQENVNADTALRATFGESAYPVLLSDGWACLHISGERVMDVLERFIALDLRTAADDFAARTTAHHISVIIMTRPDGSYYLITPRSSASAFYDALTHVIENVVS